MVYSAPMLMRAQISMAAAPHAQQRLSSVLPYSGSQN